MQFLSDVYLPCPECGGKRYKPSTLEVKLRLSDDREYSIADVLDMTATEAVALFFEPPAITSGLQQLCNVGLGYLKLGQPLTTLSGGERQRLKLAGTLAEGLSVSSLTNLRPACISTIRPRSFACSTASSASGTPYL